MYVIKPPHPIITKASERSVFLAGSIEMGSAIDWQSQVEEEFKNVQNLVILNPRRDEWDSSWEQSSNNPVFVQQVTWEMDGLDFADVVFIYFAPGTRAPITLFEFGLHINQPDQQIIVCCPDGFWRKGNVEIACNRYNLPLYNSLEDAMAHLHFEIASTE